MKWNVKKNYGATVVTSGCGYNVTGKVAGVEITGCVHGNPGYGKS